VLWGNDLGKGDQMQMPQQWETHFHCAHVASAITRDVVDLGYPVARCLASTGRRDGGWVCSEFQMAEDFANHRALRDDGDEPQCPALAQLSLSRLNHWLPRSQAYPEVMQGTTDFHHEIANTLLPQADPVFHDATALHTAVDMLDP
jgi:hypothetical protein